MDGKMGFCPPTGGQVERDPVLCRMLTVLLGEGFYGLSCAIGESLSEEESELVSLELEQVRFLMRLVMQSGGRITPYPARFRRQGRVGAEERLSHFCDRCRQVASRTSNGAVRAGLAYLAEQKELYLRRVRS